MPWFPHCCWNPRSEPKRIHTSSDALSDSGFTVDRWMSRGRVAKVRRHQTVLVCRIHSNETLAAAERDTLRTLTGNRSIPLSVRVDALPRCAFYKYVPGIDLHQASMARIFSANQLKTIFRKVAEALEFCHTRGVAHLDVKPENIIVSYGAVPVLVDWEYAIRVDDPFELKLVTPKRGTRQYMAPEMRQESRGGAPSDVWSLVQTYVACAGNCLPDNADCLTVPSDPRKRPTMAALLFQ